MLDSRDDEITELKIRLADAVDLQDRHLVERESLQKQLDGMMYEWRNFKEEANQKYENYAKRVQ